MIYTTMSLQILRVHGPAMLSEISWCCACCEVQEANTSCHEVGFFDFAAPDCAIYTFFNEIGAPLPTGESPLHVGIASEELRTGRDEYGACHQRWHIHT